LKFKIATIVLAGVGLVLSMAINAQSGARQPAESSLVGVKLFETGVSLVRRFGSPDVIEPIVVGGGQAGPAGGGGGGGAGSGQLGLAPGTGGAPGGGGGGAVNTPNADFITPGAGILGNPFDFPQTTRQLEGGMPAKGGDGGGQTNMGSGGGGPAIGGPAPGGAPPSGGGFTGGGQNVTFTRWLYRRGSSRYGFVVDRFNRVVQIEAVGLADSRVRTRRGVGFGSTFAQLMQRYGAPDGYEIGGDSILVRYLNNSRVAFRLSRLAPNRPHQVTGIVVSAGKP
jgi:hypothetical protein